MERQTFNLGVNYYVKEDFETDYQGESLRRIERNIEQDYIDALRQSCYREKQYSKFLFTLFFPFSPPSILFLLFSILNMIIYICIKKVML
jgi:hypothetical protein